MLQCNISLLVQLMVWHLSRIKPWPYLMMIFVNWTFRGAIWPSLSPCTVINPILLTYLLDFQNHSLCMGITKVWINKNVILKKMLLKMLSVKWWPFCSGLSEWTHCGLVIPYGEIKLGQRWLRHWPNATNRMAWQWAETLVEIRGTRADIRGTPK